MSRQNQQLQNGQRRYSNRQNGARHQSVSRQHGALRHQSASMQHDTRRQQNTSMQHDMRRRQNASMQHDTRRQQSASMQHDMRRQQNVSRQNDVRRQYGQTQYRQGSHEYQHGTAVREPSFEELLEEAPKKKPNHTARKNRERAVQMNLGYVLFLVGALALAAVVLIGYLNLRSDITNSVKRVSRMESELHALRQDNDEYETRINSSIDLEEVKRIAICELGMKYATEGQIIRVEGGGDDYARKYEEIPAK